MGRWIYGFSHSLPGEFEVLVGATPWARDGEWRRGQTEVGGLGFWLNLNCRVVPHFGLNHLTFMASISLL